MRIEMPFLLQCGMALSTLIAVLCTFILGLFGVVAIFNGQFTVDDRAVSRAEFFRQAGWIFPVVAAICIALGAIAYSLRREQPWSRQAILAFWVVNALCGALVFWLSGDQVTGSDALQAAAFYIVMAGIASWYLYAKDNVRAYYAALARREPGNSASTAPGTARPPTP
jgi:hypothetical protein